MASEALVGAQGVGLAVAAVEGHHQLGPQALAERVFPRELLQFGDHVAMTAQREIGLDPILEHRQALLVQAVDLIRRERLVAEVGECRAPPQRERLAEEHACPFRVRCSRATGLLGDPLEPARVQVVRLHRDGVARWPRDDGSFRACFTFGMERVAQFGDVELQGLRSTAGRASPPDVVEQRVDRHHPAAGQQEADENGLLLGSRDRHGTRVGVDLERTEDPEPHCHPPRAVTGPRRPVALPGELDALRRPPSPR